MNSVDVLLKLAQLGAIERYINLTTRELGELLGTSQQSASLYLQRLEKEGCIHRVRRNSGTSITITKEGLETIQGLHGLLRSIFETSRTIMVKGNVSRGLGEGAYYMSQKQYVQQIKGHFGFEPFGGTLNIVISPRDAPVLELLKKGPGIIVDGFNTQGRTFGTCLCYPCTVNGEKGVIMVPRRSVHVSTIEVVSEVKFRDRLRLGDGDQVEVMITYPAYELGCSALPDQGQTRS
ncbi:MAG: DUF120 domain-containing protein [Candidatus Thermoplasmatota archaeon]|nr:DUF120 domain-containing protein [Candidatus Thermoplasmatota archaeon]